MRRRTLLVVLVGLAVVVAAGVVAVWLQSQPDRITQANFERIRDGMTRAEVAAILGPPGDFRTQESIFLEPPTTDRTVHYPPPGPPIVAYDQWISDSHVASIAFCPASCLVEAKWFMDNVPIEQSVFETALWRLKRLWQRWLASSAPPFCISAHGTCQEGMRRGDPLPRQPVAA
jgi:hypothetical protein